MKLRYKNIALVTFLALVLLVPYFLRILDNRLELYPSIVLPMGAWQTTLGEEVRVPVNEVYGITPQGELKNLEKSAFLKVIRVGYFTLLHEANFGLVKVGKRDFRTIRMGIPISVKSKVSQDDIRETRIWIRERLREQGCLDSVLILKRKFIVIKDNGRFYEDNILVNDTIFRLY